ncbi:GNAT domain-containing protein [Aspergillus aurantiobrunneus]
MPTTPPPKTQYTMTFRTARMSFTPLALSDTRALHTLRVEPEVMKWTRQRHPDASLQETEDWIRTVIGDPRPDADPESKSVDQNDGAASASATEPSGGSKSNLNPSPSQGKGKGKGINFSVRGREHVQAMQDGEEKEDRIIGIIGVREKESALSKSMHYELGYMFVPAVWGRGYASEAVRGILGWWFGYLRDTTKEGEEGGVVDTDGVYAIVSKANGASLRVMEKAGFRVNSEGVDETGSEAEEVVEFRISRSTT